MADHVTQGFNASLPTDDTGTPRIRSLITLAKRGMRILGSQDDETVKQIALEGVQRAVSDVNLSQLFDFTVTKTTDTPLVENQSEYSLPQFCYAPREMLLVDDSETPEETRPLRALDWDQFQRMYQQGDTGHPDHWIIRDAWIDKSVLLWPVPDAEAASRWKLRQFYHERVQNPPLNDELLEIAGPEELAEVIISYVRYHLLMNFERENSFAIRQAYGEYKTQLQDLKGAENRTKGADLKIRMDGFRTGRRRNWSWLGRRGY